MAQAEVGAEVADSAKTLDGTPAPAASTTMPAWKAAEIRNKSVFMQAPVIKMKLEKSEHTRWHEFGMWIEVRFIHTSTV